MTDLAIRKSILLRAAPDKVWAFLTDPDKLSIWFHRPDVPLTGGAYEMIHPDSGDRFMWGEVQRAEPFSALEYTFEIAPMAGAASLVKWTLADIGVGTQLTLEHSGLPKGADAFDLSLALDKGWEKHMADMRTDLHQ